MSDLETLSAEDYGKLTGTDQRTRWRKATREAEWQAAQGKMGSLILKQRSRGHRADRLAIAFLVALIVTVLFGLVYYVVVPLWQQLNDAERRAYEAQVEILDGQLADIERERNDLWKGLVASLALTATPVESGVTASLGDLRVLPDGTTLVAAGEDGAITRSGDAGASWDPVESGVTAFLTNLRVLPDGTTLVAVGGGGAITRSTDAGGSWDPVESGVTADLIDLNVLPDGTTLVAVGRDGVITRSTDAGESWDPVESRVTVSLFDLRVLPDGTTLVAVGVNGAITRSTDAGGSWDPVESGVTASLTDLRVLPDGTTLFAVGDDGAITRSTDAGEGWDPVESGVTALLTDLRVLPDGTTLVAVGDDGAITRSTDAGESWDPVESGVTAFLTNLRVLPDGTTLVAVGGGGAITRSTDAGGSWDPVESGVTADLIDLNVLPDGTTLVAVAWGGAILILDDRYFRELDGMDLLRGSEGDGQVDKAFDDLPATVRGTPTRTEFRRAFYEAVLDRPTLLSQRQTAQTAADEISTGGFSLAQRREDFAAFMVSCRSDKAGADTDKGCADAYVALRASETPGPWQVLAERVPQAVLILFLLATLGGLYRYNLRLAGFYHARADALELLGEGKGATDADILDRLGTALAADKVEFGKGNTPSDQATELAKAVMARSSG